MNNSREALTLEKIGARIRSKRESLGMTQQELSDIVGVSRNTISRYELGQLEMKIMTLCVIAYALQTTPGILLWETDDTDESKIIAGLQDLNSRDKRIITNTTLAHIEEVRK